MAHENALALIPMRLNKKSSTLTPKIDFVKPRAPQRKPHSSLGLARFRNSMYRNHAAQGVQ
jgi:hypothetical protein